MSKIKDFIEFMSVGDVSTKLKRRELVTRLLSFNKKYKELKRKSTINSQKIARIKEINKQLVNLYSNRNEFIKNTDFPDIDSTDTSFKASLNDTSMTAKTLQAIKLQIEELKSERDKLESEIYNV